MLPVGHAAVGLLAYAAVQLPRDWRNITGLGVVAALLGSQFPDIIDKPLAYYQLLPSGRSLAHSLLFLLAVGVVLYALTPTARRGSALAFWVAAFSHPLADAHQTLLSQGITSLPGYLLWPVTRAPRYGEHAAPWVRVARIYAQPSFGGQTLVLVTSTMIVLTGRALLEVYEPSISW